MKPFFEQFLNSLEKTGISFMIGADSLVGLSEGDLFKYSTNLKLFVFRTNLLRWLILAIRLLFLGIILKPKIKSGYLYFKIRKKSGLFSKEPEFAVALPMNEMEQKFQVVLGGRSLKFDFSDILEIEKKTDYPVPKKMTNFVRKYRSKLLADFYKNHNVSLDSNSETEAVELLHSVVKILNGLKIESWVEGGTLLGAVRDKKLIPWDHDLDMGMKFESTEQMKKIIRILKEKFYVQVKNFPKKEGIWQLGDYRVLKIFPKKNIFFKGELCLDLFVYYREKLPNSDKEVYQYVVWDRNAYHELRFFDSVEQMTFYGKPIPIPAETEQFLAVKYGEGWWTPKKEWNVALDDGSVYKGTD